MKRRTLIASIGAVAGTTLGAAAYSSATVSRTAMIDVSHDQNAFITLTAGESSFITNGSGTDGALTIDIGGEGDVGLNQDATFTFGDDTDGTTIQTDKAFTIASNDPQSRDLTLNYTLSDPNPDVQNVLFKLYTVDTSTTPATLSAATEVSEQTTDIGVTLNPSDEYYVVLQIDTTGVSGGANALGAELTIDAI